VRRGRRPTGRGPVAQPPWWASPLPVAAVVVLVVGAIVVFLLVSRSQAAPAPIPSPSTQSQVLADLAGLDVQRTEAIAAGGLKSPLQKVSATPLVGPQGKPELLYIGAEFCPFCAAQRWSLAIVLARFGTLSGVGLTTSSSSDVFPDTATLTFVHSSYTSSYIEFAEVEETDRNRNPLQSPTAEQQRLFDQLNSRRSIPFSDFGNRWVTIGSGFQPDVLQGMTWQQIADQLKNNPQGPAASRILGNANWMTAAVCQQLASPPDTVCGGPDMTRLRAQLASGA
jgi:hypothetical protein